MNHEIKTAPYARRTMIAAAVMALFAAGANAAGGNAAGANAEYAHSPNTNLTPINGPLPQGALPDSWDPTYNVCRGVDPKCYHNWVDNRQMKVLVYSRTAGPRHGHLGTALTAGKNTQTLTATGSVTCTPNTTSCPAIGANNVAQAALRSWLNAEGIAVDITEDVTQINNLNQYRAIVFLSTTRDTMWKHGSMLSTSNTNLTNNTHLDAAKTALRQYMRAGGGFTGIHNVFGTEYNWPYYEGLVGNANYYDHGANQSGTVHLTGSPDPSTQGLPSSWTTIDEWYNFQPYPTNVKVTLRLDELTLAQRTGTHPGHGDFSPRAWCQNYDGGHVWVTPIGHNTTFFQDGSNQPGQAEFKRLVVQGIKMTMGVDAALGSGTPTSPPPVSTTFCPSSPNPNPK
jgi:type 1 glutamine amidotransferase